MQMLYRLSYVGASSGLLEGSAGLWMLYGFLHCHRMQTRFCVLAREDAAFPHDSRFRKSMGRMRARKSSAGWSEVSTQN